MKKSIIYLTLATLFLVSCKTQSLQTLSNQKFTITELNGKPLKQIEEVKPSISFTTDQVNATVGCNSIFATYVAKEGGKLIFENGGATRMMCPEQMRENEFIDAFNKVAHYVIKGKEIFFYDSNSILLFKGKK